MEISDYVLNTVLRTQSEGYFGPERGFLGGLFAALAAAGAGVAAVFTAVAA